MRLELLLLPLLVICAALLVWTLAVLQRERQAFFRERLERALRATPQEHLDFHRLRRRYRVSHGAAAQLARRVFDEYFWSLARDRGVTGDAERRLENAALILSLDREFLHRYTEQEVVRMARALAREGRPAAPDETQSRDGALLVERGLLTADELRAVERHRSSRRTPAAAAPWRSPADAPVRLVERLRAAGGTVTPELLVGAEIGGCRLEELLGRGGMGVVFRARHLTSGQPVAVKVLDRGADAGRVRRLLREARATARLAGPEIVRVLHVGSDEDLHFLLLEYVDGENLQTRMDRRGRLPPAEALAVLVPVLRGLQRAHRAGIIHRDIKPQNILLGRDGRVALGDFGLALDSQDSVSLTASDQVLGTPHYMAPEQCEGRRADQRTDLYAVGVTAFYLLTGARPFQGATSVAVMYQHLHAEVPPLAADGECFPDFEPVVRRLLAKDPARRYPDAAAVLAALAPPARHAEVT